MLPEQRASIDNGIWLCATHADQIDGDEVTWTVQKLHALKTEAENRSRASLGVQRTVVGAAPTVAGLTLASAACVYMQSIRAAYLAVEILNEAESPNSIRSVSLKIGDREYFPAIPRSGIALSGLAWLQPPPLRVDSVAAVFGAWFFGWSFESGGAHVEASPTDHVTVTITTLRGPPISGAVHFTHPEVVPSDAALARVRAGVTSDGLARDRAVFAAFDEICDEQQFRDFFDMLTTSDEFIRSSKRMIDDYIAAGRLEGNRFLDALVSERHEAFLTQLNRLAFFLGQRFFIYPQGHPSGEHGRMVLAPDLSPSRGQYSPEKKARYDELQGELDDLVRSAKERYAEYRAAVREGLQR